MRNSRTIISPRPASLAVIVSLFLALYFPSSASEPFRRVTAPDYPLAVEAPSQWEEIAPGEEAPPGEVLFLQTPEGAPFEAVVSFSAHPVTGSWDDLVRRQTYHLLVWEGAPLSVDEALKLKGAKGHKWVYTAPGRDGTEKLFYRLYLLLPESVGSRRLLLMQGAAPASESPHIVPLFNSMARSLTWGLL